MKVESTNSTNTLLRELVAKGEAPEFVYTDFQTEGRGQTGNTWESEAGKNLLCSILLEPDDEPFYLTVAVSVALYKVVADAIEETARTSENEIVSMFSNDFYGLASYRLTIKWPNDLYYEQRKLAGVLIETGLCGNRMDYAIAGIGLNVNQTRWRSAPNPTSLKTVCKSSTFVDKVFDIDLLMEKLNKEVREVLQLPRRGVWEFYKSHLFRGGDGPWPFVERTVDMAPTMNAPKGTKGTFKAWIVDVKPDGRLVLQDEDGEMRFYHFKQIRYVL